MMSSSDQSDSARIAARFSFWYDIYKFSLMPEGVSERECAKFAMDKTVRELAEPGEGRQP